MAQRKPDELSILRKKAAAKLKKELEELHNLSAEELKIRYFEIPETWEGTKEPENKFKNKSEELQTIFDASPNSIWYKDTKNNFIRVNQAAAKIAGLEIDEIVGRSADEIFPLESEKQYKDDLEVIKTGNPKIGIIESVTTKGNTRWVRTDKIPWYTVLGEIAGIIAFSRDITDQKIAVQNLKESEELFRTVISNAPISIFATDEKGIFTLHEGKAIERVGMKSGENVGVSAYDLFSGLKVIEHNGTVSSGKSILDRVSKGEYLSGITELNGIIFDNQFAPIWDEHHKVSGLLGVATDITERMQAEDALRESETYNRMLFDQSVIGLALADLNGKFVDVNQAFSKIIGRTIEETVKLTYWDITPGKYAEQEKAQLDSLNITGRYGPYEKEYIHKNGKLVPVRLQGVIIERNRQKYIWSSIEDISGRKQLEAERLAFEKRYQMLFNKIDEGFCIVEMIFDKNENPIDYRFLEVNPAFEKQTDLVVAQGKRMRELKPQHENHWFEIYGKIALTGEPARFVNRAEQLQRWYDVYAFRFGQPEKRQVAILFNDITERIRIQDELRVREEKWHNLFEILPVGVSIVNIQNNTLEINDALSEILDIPKNELIKGAYRNRSYFRSDMTPMPPEEFPSIRVLREKKIVRDVEIGIKKEDGTIIWTNVSAAPMSSLQSSVTITIDITKHKQALDKIKESEHNLAEAERIGNTGSWEYNVATDTASWSENMFRIFDVDPDQPKELVFRYFVENLVHPDDRSHILSVFQETLAGKDPYDLEYRIIKRDGSIRIIHSLAETLFDGNGKAIRMIGKVEDITERKRMEKILRESEERYRLILENSMDAILYTAPDGSIFSANLAACKMFQRTEDEICRAGRAGLTVVDDPRLNKLINERKRHGKARGETTLIRKDGTIFNAELSASTFTDSNGNLRTSIIIRDITERKQMELAVEEYKYFLRNVLDTNPNIIFVINKEGKIILANKAFAEFYSSTVENIEGHTQQEIHKKYHLPLNDLELWLAENLHVITTGQPLHFIVYSTNRDGYGAWYRTRKVPIKLPVGEKAALVVGEDITELKKTEEDRLFLAEITLNISEGISLVRESDGIIVFTNKRFEEMFGYNAGELIGQHVKVLNASTTNQAAYDTAQSIIGSMQNKEHWKTEVNNIKKDGTLFWTEASISRFDHPEYGKVLLAIQMDIDKRKLIENKLIEHEHDLQHLSTELINAQEKERKILAQELHDEVGQSLTAMKINLASIMKKLPVEHDAKTKNRLQEMNEIMENLISQVHEISLNLRPAMLDVLGLLPTIKSYLNQFSERTGIIVRLINNININLEKEQEIHLFRIVQEALTNVVKHAQAKNIFLHLNIDVNILILSIQDDGCGFILNEKESIPHVGIGLIGMRERVNSLKGKMEIITSPQKGTKIEIQIPVSWKNE